MNDEFSELISYQQLLDRYPPISSLDKVYYRFRIDELRKKIKIKLPPRRVKLLEVGKDFEIKIKTYSKDPKYVRYKKLVLLKKTIRITTQKIKEIAKRLQERYPYKGYYFERAKVHYEIESITIPVSIPETGTRIFWIIGRKEEGRKGIPIYYSSTLGKLFVPKSFVDRKYRLVCSVLMYRLRDLGIRYSLRYIR